MYVEPRVPARRPERRHTAQPPRRRWHAPLPGRVVSAGRPPRISAALLLVLLVWLVAYPIVLVLVEGLRGPSGWTLEHVRVFLSRSTEWQALWGSLWTSLASVVLAAAIGVPLAFLFSRYDLPGRRILGGLIALPAVLPPRVGVIACARTRAATRGAPREELDRQG